MDVFRLFIWTDKGQKYHNAIHDSACTKYIYFYNNNTLPVAARYDVQFATTALTSLINPEDTSTLPSKLSGLVFRI
jgi:hypothetical protein